MKKLSLSLPLTLAAVVVAATGTGCGSSPSKPNNLDGGGAGIALVPSADGFFDGTNEAGILGAWYSYGDWYNPMPAMGDCAILKGVATGYTAAQCSSITAPVPGNPFTNTDGVMCTTGTAALVIDANYSAIWGTGIGFDLNNAGNDGGTGKNAWDPTPVGVTGFSFHIDTPPTGGQMRVEFPTNVVPGTTDINSAYWAGENADLSPIKNAGDYSFHWADVGGPKYLSPHMPFDKTKIISMQFHVVTNTSSAIPFMYCISNLRALKD